MKIIDCEIQLKSEFESDDDVVQRVVSQKRVVREGLESFFRNFLENYVRPELGAAYRLPVEIPIAYGNIPSDYIAVMKLYLPEENEHLKYKLTMMLLQDIKDEFGDRYEQYSVLINYQRAAA